MLHYIYFFAKTNQKNKISKYLADLSSKFHICAGTVCHGCKIIIETNPELFTANLSAKICTKGTQQVFPIQSNTTLQRYSHLDVLLDIIKSKPVSYWVNQRARGQGRDQSGLILAILYATLFYRTNLLLINPLMWVLVYL